MNIFTPTCHYCNKRISNPQEIFCVECYGILPKTEFGFSRNNVMKEKLKGLLPIEFAGAFLYYNKGEMVKEILNQIKYNQNTSLSYQLGIICASHLRNDIKNVIDLLIPIPLHPAKLMLRGYNQTEYFGQGLSDELNIPMDTTSFTRVINTPSQTQLTREKRYHNVENVFKFSSSERIRKQRVLLIDDVMTTGATLESAGRAILKAKPLSLNILTLATAFDL